MIEINGHWYDGRTSARVPCLLRIDDVGGVDVLDASGAELHHGLFETLRVSSRLGNTPRFLDFPEGQRVETTDNEAVDRALARLQPHARHNWVHRLESHKRFVVLTLLLVIVFIGLVGRYGAPAIARVGAAWVPDAAVQLIGEQALETLDDLLFEPSELSDAVRERVVKHLAPAIADHPHLRLRLEFRTSEEIGPNAFALPDGTIIMTDAMVRLAEHDDELLAVFVHEIGHVEYRHSMRRLIQGSVLAFLLTVIAGDISGTSEFFLGIPILLTELAYSRDFEREADSYAIAYLSGRGTSATHFAAVMRRLEAAHACAGKSREECDPGELSQWHDYLSSHPGSDERAARAEAAR